MPGSWEPGRIHVLDAIFIKIFLITASTLRGFDYLLPSGNAPATIESMASAFPIAVWAWMLLIPSSILLIGLSARLHFAVWLGHGLLAVVYMGLFASFAMVFVERPYFNGMRSATELLVPLLLHALICVRTGWRPPRCEVIKTDD